MFRARITKCIALVVTVVWAVIGPFFAWALSPSLDVAQHGHRAWRNLDGFGLGAITAIAQTTDGYMWLATPTGLLRFDGVRTVPVRHAVDTEFDESVRALRGARDGTLWIGTSRGLFGFRNGAFLPNASLSDMAINAIAEDSDGTIWVAGATNGQGRLCALRKHGDECHGQDGRLGLDIVGLHRDSANALWVVGLHRAWKWGSDPMVSFALPTSADVLRSVAEMADGAIVIGLRGQVARIANGKLENLPLPSWTRQLALDKALVDRHGSLWLGTADSGLLHLTEGRLDTYAMTDGLSGDTVLDIFEDREGNVWVSTSRGLDRFRPIAAAIQSGLNGLKGRPRAVLRARDGSMWASTTFGIYQQHASNTWTLRRSWLAGVSSLFEDHLGRIWAPSHYGVQYFDGNRFVDASGIPAGPIDAMAEDSNGDLWLAHRELGLLRVQTDGNAHFAVMAVLRPSSRVSTLTIDPVDQSLWVGLWSGTLENVREGRLSRGPALLDGPTTSSRINHIRTEPDGTLWVSTFAGLHRISHGRVVRLNVESGLSCDQLFSSFADETSLWLNAQCGLIRVDRAAVDAWAEGADKGIHKQVTSQLLDIRDGVDQGIAGRSIGYVNAGYNHAPKFARSTEGWPLVVTSDSLVTINPGRVAANDQPPPVYIEKLVSNGQSYELQSGLRLPPLQQNLEIDYTGLNFASPERVQFRYKLEGRDTDWQDAGHRRQAFYTDLAPGQYRFRVTAANERGAWNPGGDSIEFLIEPAWWQTLTFRVACAAAIVLMLYALYRSRIAELSRRLASETAASQENARLYRDLQEREARVRRLFNSNIIGIFTWNLDGRILDANDAFGRIVGYDSHDVLSGQLRWKDLMPPEWDPNDDQIMTNMLATGVAPPFEAEYVSKDGSRVPVLIGAALFDRTPTEGVAFVLDLTDRKQAEQAARDSDQRYLDIERKLSDANRIASIAQLSATIAHEINQPLAGIVANASTGLRMLDADPPNIDGARETARRAIRDGNRAAEVITRLRALFSRKEIVLKPMDLNEATREVIAMTWSDLEKNSVVMQVTLAEELPFITGDRIQLQQVILNLLRNASDAMSGVHDRPRRLLISTERDGDDRVRLAVRDAGVGLDPQDIEKLFNAFYSTTSGGMGVGLSISRSIIERHHGRLWAESNDDHGATFSFSIPCHPESWS